MAAQKKISDFPLKHALMIAALGGRIATVPIYALTQADRISAERHAPSSATDQDDFILSRMTGLPLDAVDQLAYADGADLMDTFVKMAGLDVDPATVTDTIQPGYTYTLLQPINTPNGMLTSLTLHELTRGDQKAAGQYSNLATEQEGFLIGRMANLQLEDVAALSIADSFVLPRFFRRIVDTTINHAAVGSGADAIPQAQPSGLASDAAV